MKCSVRPYLAGLKGLKSSSSKATSMLCCFTDFACRVVSAVLNLAMKLSSLVLNWNVSSKSNTSMALSTDTCDISDILIKVLVFIRTFMGRYFVTLSNCYLEQDWIIQVTFLIMQLIISTHFNISATIGDLLQELNCHCLLDDMMSSDNSVC